MDPQEKELIAILQESGSEHEKHKAWEELQKLYRGRIYAHIVGMIKDRAKAEDLTQDVMLKAYKNIGGFRKDASFSTWIYRIAINATIDEIRRLQKRQASEFDERIDTEIEGDLHTRPDQPFDQVHGKELGERIQWAMSQLSPQQRQVIILREVQGRAYKEIAEIMDIPEGTVMSRLYYARERLKRLLQPEALEAGLIKPESSVAEESIKEPEVEEVEEPEVAEQELEQQEAELRGDDAYLAFLGELISALDDQIELNDKELKQAEEELAAAKKRLAELES